MSRIIIIIIIISCIGCIPAGMSSGSLCSPSVWRFGATEMPPVVLLPSAWTLGATEFVLLSSVWRLKASEGVTPTPSAGPNITGLPVGCTSSVSLKAIALSSPGCGSTSKKVSPSSPMAGAGAVAPLPSKESETFILEPSAESHNSLVHCWAHN